jgi:hypothetical protein
VRRATRQVKDLSPEQKRAAEILLGSEDDAVSIRSLGPTTIIPSKLSPEERLEALRDLEKRFSRAHQSEVSAEEEEAGGDEALRSCRPGYRPVAAPLK